MQEIEEKITFSTEWEIDNLPNRITIFRITLIPIIITSLSLNLTSFAPIVPYHTILGYIAAFTFIIASITDFIDGHIARSRNIVTVFGSFLDPIADKFLVISSLIMLQALGRIPVLLVLILVLREMYITALRLLASEKNLSVPVNRLGKWKTATQMIGIPFLMAYDKPWSISMPLIGTAFIYVAVIFSIYSASTYSLSLLKKLKEIKRLSKEKRSNKS